MDFSWTDISGYNVPILSNVWGSQVLKAVSYWNQKIALNRPVPLIDKMSWTIWKTLRIARPAISNNLPLFRQILHGHWRYIFKNTDKWKKWPLKFWQTKPCTTFKRPFGTCGLRQISGTRQSWTFFCTVALCFSTCVPRHTCAPWVPSKCAGKFFFWLLFLWKIRKCCLFLGGFEKF